MSEAPIFIVGVPRSGTTLLAAMLASHSRLSCGPETHFFRQLSKIDPAPLTQDAAWLEPAIQFLDSITFGNYRDAERSGVIEKYALSRDCIKDFLSKREPSIANILSSITVPFMEGLGKSRWVEKTPDHIEYVAQIRQYFPASPIVQILRDPRDVTISLMKVPWGIGSLLEGLFYWKRLYESSEDFFRDDPLAYVLKYENLVACPVEELERLCQFIGEDFESEMLDTSNSAKKLNSVKVSWKEKASQPLDTGRLNVWRNELSAAEKQLAEAFIGDKLAQIGFPVEEVFDRLGEIHPSEELILKYENSLYSFTSQRVRFWKQDKQENASLNIFLGDSSNDDWLKGARLERLAQAFSLLVNILRTIASKQTIYWISEAHDRKSGGLIAGLLTRALSPYRQDPEPFSYPFSHNSSQ